MPLFDRYVFKNIFIATVFTAVVLMVVIVLTQSLRFLELVIEAGASSATFWFLTVLALPRFLEIILPLSLLGAVLFIYNRMTADSELVVIRSAGFGPLRLSQPAIVLGCLVTLFLWGVTLWLAPVSLYALQEKRQEVRTQFSTLIFREGVFNQVGQGVTVYARKRADDGTLRGLMIHDGRESEAQPVTVLANRGALVRSDQGYEVVVYDGTRQSYDLERNILSRLDFEQYTIDFPAQEDLAVRWKQPDERTIFELLNPDMDVERDRDNSRGFFVELHRRIVGPLLALSFTLMGCAALLVGPVDRRGQFKRIVLAVVGVVSIQGLYIASYNIATNSNFGLVLMYVLALGPILGSGFILSHFGDYARRALFYNKNAGRVS